MSTQTCIFTDAKLFTEARLSTLNADVGRISGPLLDRIDIHIDVPAVRFKDLSDKRTPEGESSTEIRARVPKARARQRERFRDHGIFSNAQMPPRLIRRYCHLEATAPSTALIGREKLRR